MMPPDDWPKRLVVHDSRPRPESEIIPANRYGSISILSRHEEIDGAVDLTFEAIERWYAQRNLDAINQFLGLIDPTAVHPRVTSNALRCSARTKNRLDAWAALRDRALKCLDFTDPKVKRLFRGL